MPILRLLRLLSLVVFYPSFGFGIFAMLAQEYNAGSALLALAAASGVWVIVCTVADRIVSHLENMERSLAAISHSRSASEDTASKPKAEAALWS